MQDEPLQQPVASDDVVSSDGPVESDASMDREEQVEAKPEPPVEATPEASADPPDVSDAPPSPSASEDAGATPGGDGAEQAAEGGDSPQAETKDSSDESHGGGGGGERQGRRGRGRGRRRRGRREREEPEFELDPDRVPSTEPLGTLEVLGSGSGFIRRQDVGYIPSRDDIYVGAKVISKFGLRTGDELAGVVGRRPRNGKSPPLMHLDFVNGKAPEEARQRPDFNRLSAVHPDEQLRLECGREVRGEPDYTNRVIDLFCPFGKGQRAMIVAPAKAGKTTVLQAVAEGIVSNHPECRLIILLVDERPEEITDMEMCGFGEVVASSFDQPAERHCQVAEITLERARRLVESGEDVVIILDSITRLARAYNTIEEGSGRTLTGGLDAQSLEKPKRFLGSARKINPKQGGGSLTIVATALVDTGSRMDQVIFEEFKGTGNSELVLSREIADRRIFPAIDLSASATRKEELLLESDYLKVSHAMRRQLSEVAPADAMSELLGVMRKTRSNEGLVAMAQQRM
jgi:transcription termination factor Rho